MAEIHEFKSPRNLYEKLVRDNQRLEKVVNGDNLFTFISTAVSLQPWIKNSPLGASETMNRILRKIVRDPFYKTCKDISLSKSPFKLDVSDDNSATIHVGKDKIDVYDFRNQIINLFDNFFKQK